ncbi:unnamed protein product [Rotaria sp. Silwood2]|nr:unnamed protein product [Rotaria sp. Silwood2]CAF4076579.1 unnamed protein product [Rotaria sp. Silwood2]
MSATRRLQKELEIQSKHTLATTKDPLERLRAACLARGAQGIKGLSILFRIMDDDKSKKLTFDEFKKGVEEYGLNFSKAEIEDLFRIMDIDQSGHIDYEEFLRRLRPPMNNFRLDLIAKAFAKLDKNHDGQITVDDLRGLYIVKNHPKYMNGEWSEDQVLRHFLDCFDYGNHKDGVCVRRQELSNIEEVQSSFEPLLWRKQSSLSCMAQHFSKNQNTIDHHHSQNVDISLSNQKESQQLPTTSLPSTNFTTERSVELRKNSNNESEKVDSHLSKKSVTITGCNSKSSQYESTQIATNKICQYQRDRYIKYCHRFKANRLYSLFISSNGIECYETNCQPSVFTASIRCQTISHDKNIDAIEETPLMNDQDIKQTISYISLTNLSNIIDHEPNVSRNESNSRSTSNILLHKPSLFLADILNKMTQEQLVKSIAQLTKLHEHRTKSNITLDKLQRTTSLPDLSNKPTKLHSVTSLLSERTPENIIQIENKIPSIYLSKQKHIKEDMISIPIDLETSRDKCSTDINEKTILTVVGGKFQTPMYVSEPLDQHIISSPTKLISVPKRKLSQENLQTIHINDPPGTTSAMSSPIVHPLIIKPSSISTESSKSNIGTNVEKEKISRNKYFYEIEFNEQVSKSKYKPSNTSKIEQNNVEFSILSNRIDITTCASSLNSMTNSVPIKNQQFDKETKSEIISKEKNHQLSQETNLENNEDLFSKSNMKQNLHELYSKNNMNQSLKNFSSCNKITDHPSQTNILLSSSIPIEEKLISSSVYFQSSNNKNEIEHSMSNVTDHLSQQHINISNTNTDNSYNISSTQPYKTKRILPFMKKLDQLFQYSKSSVIEPSKTSNFVRNYGWDEIEQNEEETKRLRQLVSIWDAERIAILKLQYDLDKNIFKRTFDYVKRIGQSIRLALWLWVHRPINCSNISNLYQNEQQQSLFPVTNVHKSQNFACSPCSESSSYPLSENIDDQEKQDFSIPSFDMLADSLWYQRFVLNESQEHLPPIARAMKNMLDNNTFVWNSESQEENVWPHFINQYRVTQNKIFLGNQYENDEFQSSSSQKPSLPLKYATNEIEPNTNVTDTDTKNKNKTDRHSPKETNTSIEQNTTNISSSTDSQHLLKPADFSLKKDKRSSTRKQQQKLKEKR